MARLKSRAIRASGGRGPGEGGRLKFVWCCDHHPRCCVRFYAAAVRSRSWLGRLLVFVSDCFPAVLSILEEALNPEDKDGQE